MELISREATIKSLCAYHKGKKTIGQCIDDVPTIQAIPIEVLQEIKREINLLKDQVQTDAHTITAYT